MGVLTVVPSGLFPKRFTVVEDGRSIAEMRFAWLVRESNLVIGDLDASMSSAREARSSAA